jgi:adenosylmethionine---8-amino-7-oxononanoate aminotransferase
MEIRHRQHLTKLANKYPQLTKLRGMGTIAAIDINNHEESGYLNNVGREIRHQAMAHGVLLHPLGSVVYLMPPYCITEAELTWVYQQIDRVLAKVLDRSAR